MTQKHTPGPWHIVPTLTGALSINKTAKVPVATVGGACWHLGEDVAMANAALIAAAPDLLAIARRIAEWEAAPDRFGGDLADVAVDARAAIAKAEGRA